jgi:hypothetical protein
MVKEVDETGARRVVRSRRNRRGHGWYASAAGEGDGRDGAVLAAAVVATW